MTRPVVTRLLLLRHGQIASHRGDVPVTAEGLATAAGVGGALAAPGRPVRVLSGNTLRTRQTAQAIADGARHAGGIVDGPTEAFALRNPDPYLAGTRVDMVSTAGAFAEQVPGMSEEDVARAPTRRPAMSTDTVRTINPATGETLQDYPAFTRDQIGQALAQVHGGQPDWAATDPADRAACLSRIAARLHSGREPLARLAVLEMGKPIGEALAEVDKCAWACEYYAETGPRLLADQDVPTGAQRSWVAHEPLGVILAVMPWNFPYWQVFRFLAPTLMAGNAALLKHSPNVTGCALAIEDVLRDAGLPSDVFRSLVIAEPDVPAATERLITDPSVAAVSLTGSERAGAAVAAAAGRVLKKSLLELGGSDPFVVLDDVDLDTVVASAVRSRFLNSGQSCLAAKRFIAHTAVAERFTEQFTKVVDALVVCDPADPATQLGPLARADLVDALHTQVSVSVAAGATVRAGGRRLDRRGAWYAPTVLGDVTAEMPAMTEETFGPAAAVITVHDDDEAARVANATRYGLGASVWSGNPDRALRLGRRISSGALFVNAVVASDPRLPFGGTKNSGYGRELGPAGLHEFTNARTFYVGGSERPAGPATE